MEDFLNENFESFFSLWAVEICCHGEEYRVDKSRGYTDVVKSRRNTVLTGVTGEFHFGFLENFRLKFPLNFETNIFRWNFLNF